MLLRHALALIGLCAALASFGPAGAATVPGLYLAEVPVADRAEEARLDGFELALARVLVRVTGNPGIASNPDAAPMLETAAAYVQQYGYTAAGALRVGFDGDAVRRAAAAAGLPVWGDERPATLIWLAIDSGGGRRMVLGADHDNAWRDRLEARATDRGLPILFPLLDSEDRALVGFSDIWGGFDDKIAEASARYGADAILIGRASRSGSGLFVRWKLTAGGFEDEWRGSLSSGIDGATDAFARRFAVAAGIGNGAEVTLRVEALDSIAAYGDVYNYLDSLTIVDSVAVDAFIGEQVRFRVRLRGDPGQFARALGLGALLRPLADDGFGADMRYEYRP